MGNYASSPGCVSVTGEVLGELLGRPPERSVLEEGNLTQDRLPEE